MKISTVTDARGRKYQAITDDGDDKAIPIGPPDIVDDLDLPEPFATRLHNILHARGLLNYAEVVRHPKELQGALQELYMLDAQRLTESFFKYEQEARNA